jgi:hypothetical protein
MDSITPNSSDDKDARSDRDAWLPARLLAKINKAVAAANEAETRQATAHAELVSRSKIVGQLLLEAKKLHSAVKDFEAFLKKVHGLKLSRAYDCMRIAGGRTTDEEIRKAARDRVEKHRASKKKKLPGPTPAPEKLSVTVTETAEERAAKVSAHCLAAFTTACRTWLPHITVEADRQKARLLVAELADLSGKPKAEAA